MKVLMQMSITANAMIAREDDSVAYVSKVSWNNYLAAVKKAGCVVHGRKTYALLKPDEIVDGVKYVIVTTKTNLPKKCENMMFTNDSPKKILQKLKSEGHKTVLLAGGGIVNSSFLKAGLVDEIFLDVEPKILGKGIPLFSEEEFEADLELIGTKMLSDNEIQLHYKVKK